MAVNISEYTYNLPAERIATYPLVERDQSKLLVYDQGMIQHQRFRSLAALLPANSLLVFNNTKVIPARLHFTKESGAVIEIFLLQPASANMLLMEAMQAEDSCTWKCAVGNLKRWKADQPLHLTKGEITLEASLLDREENIVKFSWNTHHTFAEIISATGVTPLPPYLKRDAEASDRDRYQTIYSRFDGAVAAPTAGLHFTSKVFEDLAAKNIKIDFLTLHVSAGTFQPVKTADAADHTMHREQIVVSRANIENMIKNEFIVPVGTTSMRTLESVYWYGVKLLHNPAAPFAIGQHDPYQYDGTLPSAQEALTAVDTRLARDKKDVLTGETSIFILPGYKFRICNALITNFHQPGSTLILLVAAFIGEDWRKVYDAALKNDYRFLSYGDSSLLFPPHTSG